MTWFPRPTDHIIATTQRGGRLLVHRPEVPRSEWFRVPELPWVVHTACDQTMFLRARRWHWIRFDSLNPERVTVCKRCANKGET